MKILNRLGTFILLSCFAISTLADSVVTYYHTDPLGSPIATTNQFGEIKWTERYEPFGERIDNPSASGDDNVWFTGKEQDKETGLVYMNARYYDPQVGRFMAMDPVGFVESNVHSFNRYTYANNNPYKYVDPNGEYADIAIEVVSIVVGLASFNDNFAQGNYLSAAVDVIGLGIDGAAILIPGIPGAAGLGLKTLREGGEVLVDPSTIRFTQNSVGKNVNGRTSFSDGTPLQNTIDALKSGGLKPEQIDPIRIFEKDGKIFTLDNRRLFAAHQAGTKVNTRRATQKEIAKDLNGKRSKFTTESDGLTVGVNGVLK